MQAIVITGNVGRDPEIRQAGSDNVCWFTVGVQQGYGERKTTNWYRCNVWGKRGDTVAQYVRKGSKVTVIGELSIGEYQGKPQYDIRVNDLDWSKVSDAAECPAARAEATASARSAAPNPFDADLDDEIPY
jgi:single-strand DNA-binding protein